ncbi:MAG: cysteine--tRNA ligase [Syntrophales bacterium]|jgi:cysteinyl-tRNA synthetase|nr:cysteine--tRNA ligase [Syntrophales bacterium]MDY0043867.1 cysteine--tRNA ligase [Syntrophales bacterium]
MEKRYNNVLDLIGNTPLVKINALNPYKNVTILAKLEGTNPGGSIKDRTALYMIERAEERGVLTKNKIIIEATSGNTGIGLAIVAAAKGYRLILAMAENASDERKKILRAMGAELLFTPAHLSTDGAIEKIYEMLRQSPDKYFMPDQFNSPDNIMAHYCGTAEEIWCQTEGNVTAVVATLGTSGTAMGVAKRLKELKASIEIIGVEPYLRHKIQGLKNMKESYRPGIFDRKFLDEKINITDEDAFKMARKLAQIEGLFVGMSSGAAMHVALEKAGKMKEGIIVAIFPDRGERYLSTELFSNKEETSLQIYNTLNRSKESFKPLNRSRVLMHSCGPSVHDVPHIGTYRRFIVADLIMRYLKYKDFDVRHEINIIDMADRSVKGADQAQIPIETYTEQYIKAFFADVKALNISEDIQYPKASENVESMIFLAEKLVEKGFAYEKLRSVYFDISRLDDYGVLSNIDLGRVRHKHTIDQDEYEKDSPVDFTLLKRSTLAELKKGIYFKTKWGNVRPSWHLECAAIARKYLADTFDIFVSGSDIIFPHCENVMAIGKAATGKTPARYWMHAEIVMRDGKKMSRSLDNTFTIGDLLKNGYTGKELRYFLISSHYRKPLNFSFGALDTSKNSVRRLNNFIQKLIRTIPGKGNSELDQHVYDVRKSFFEAMDDDFNISGALAAIFSFVKTVHPMLSEQGLSQSQLDAVIEVLKKIDDVLGIMDFQETELEKKVEDLIQQRDLARKTARWEEADRIRQELAKKGIRLQDTPDGTLWSMN